MLCSDSDVTSMTEEALPSVPLFSTLKVTTDRAAIDRSLKKRLNTLFLRAEKTCWQAGKIMKEHGEVEAMNKILSLGGRKKAYHGVGGLLEEQEPLAADMDKSVNNWASEWHTAASVSVKVPWQEIVFDAIQVFVIELGFLDEETQRVGHAQVLARPQIAERRVHSIVQGICASWDELLGKNVRRALPVQSGIRPGSLGFGSLHVYL